MSAKTAAKQLVHCARCSRTSNNGLHHWMVDSPPMVVQGVAIGLCPQCLTGQTGAEVSEDACDQSCKGKFTSDTGTYYVGKSPDGNWSCWDLACVEGWVEEEPMECYHCGSEYEVEVFRYVDGKREGLVS